MKQQDLFGCTSVRDCRRRPAVAQPTPAACSEYDAFPSCSCGGKTSSTARGVIHWGSSADRPLRGFRAMCRPPPAATSTSLTPSCACRGEFACDVISPKFALLKFCSGAPQTTRLNRLNASARTSRRSSARDPDRLGHAQVLRQVPRPAHVAVHPRRVAELPDRLHERRAIQVAIDERIEFLARERRPPVGAGDVRAVRAVEDRQRRAASSRRSAARCCRSGCPRPASRRGCGSRRLHAASGGPVRRAARRPCSA